MILGKNIINLKLKYFLSFCYCLSLSKTQSSSDKVNIIKDKIAIKENENNTLTFQLENGIQKGNDQISKKKITCNYTN